VRKGKVNSLKEAILFRTKARNVIYATQQNSTGEKGCQEKKSPEKWRRRAP